MAINDNFLPISAAIKALSETTIATGFDITPFIVPMPLTRNNSTAALRFAVFNYRAVSHWENNPNVIMKALTESSRETLDVEILASRLSLLSLSLFPSLYLYLPSKEKIGVKGRWEEAARFLATPPRCCYALRDLPNRAVLSRVALFLTE